MVVSLFIAALADLIKNSTIKNIIRILSLMPMAIIAGMRDLTIGTDIQNYGLFNFESALQFKNIFDYVKYIKYTNGVEYGYSVFNYLVSRLTNSINVFFFLLNLLTILFIILGLNVLGDKVNFELSIIIYYLLFWSVSLNVMRQSLAASIVFFAFSLYMSNNKLFYFILLILLASSIHQTALLAILLPIILKITPFKLKIKNVAIWFLLGLISITFFNPNNRFVITLMNSLPILNKYHNLFINGGMQYITGGQGMQLRYVLFRIIPSCVFIVLALLYKGSKDKEEGRIINFLFLMTLVSVFFEFVNMNSGVLSRLGMYFSVFQIIFISFLLKRKLSRRNIIVFFISLSVSILFFVVVIKSGSGELYPYSSTILNSIIH